MKGYFKTDIPIDEYHAMREYWNSSRLKAARVSTKAFKYANEQEVDKAKSLTFDFGNAFELMLLHPNKFEDQVVVFDADQRPEPSKTFATKGNKAWKAQFFEDNADKLIINARGPESLQALKVMIHEAKSNPLVRMVLASCETDVSFFWEDFGLPLKTRPDVCAQNQGILIDIKTATTSTPHEWFRQAGKYAYPFQAIMQMEGAVKSGYAKDVKGYFWLVVEKTPPYHAQLYEFAPEDIDHWRNNDYVPTMKAVSKAIKSGKYQGYEERGGDKYGVLRAEIPSFYTIN